MSTLSIAAPITPRGVVAKAGVFAAGTALAGAAVFGGAIVAPTVTAGLSSSVQRDYVLTADPAPMVTDFVASLQNLLNTLDFGTIGQVLGLFGDGIGTGSDLSVLLAALNPDNVSLDDATMNLLSTDLTALLSDVHLPVGGGATAPLGDVPIDGLLGGFIGGADGINTSIGSLLTQFGLGPYVGLLDLSFLGIDLSPTTSVADVLNDMLGIDATTSINGLLDANGFGDATIASLMGISPEQLAAGWDQFVDGITVGGTIMDPDGTGVLGDETLGGLLSGLLGAGAPAVTDATTLTDFLSEMGIFSMLGIS